MSVRPDSSNRTGRNRQVRYFVGFAAATRHRRAVDDEHVPQQISELASGICAFDGAVTHHERAVAVIDVPVAVQTTAHAVVSTSCIGQKAVLPSACRCRAYELSQRRFFGGLVSRPAAAGLVGFLAAPGLAAARRRPPFPVDRRCIAASMLARSADTKSSGTAPGSPPGLGPARSPWHRSGRSASCTSRYLSESNCSSDNESTSASAMESPGGGGPLIFICLERELRLAHLVRPQHGREDEHIAVHPQHRDDLAIAERDLGNGDAPLLPQRVA